MNFRVGNGIDCHKLVPNKKLILGGVLVDSNLGLEGHSDGDAVIHAIVDSMLGALSLGDIGTFFPSEDEQWENANSSIFLKFAHKKINEFDFIVNNIDITIILQSPSLKKYIYDIRNNISNLLNINIDCISVKATTTDKLGFIGENKGLVALVSTLLVNNGN
ncbi:MAG: 2-C-methyl-D-erythritol 2,4-cyclodiphosphate synthase [Candidatus Marinimicrobia bacterium]|nr:2-C-methyl-D-erythritol 2,4-cyclodiphosphate synthase [Candidatus Neomarinimicrobiota bacterium]|tara:strand:+ start:109968 stop:110453 length:486 start_codon:yes stop_codon:yes gene_type:complete